MRNRNTPGGHQNGAGDFRLEEKNLDVTVLATGQHSWMLDQALAFLKSGLT